jgi:HK97 family phage major capsid protein
MPELQAPNSGDLELIRQLRAEWKTVFTEGIATRDQKGYTDSDAREKLEKIDTKLNTLTDTVIAGQAKSITDLEGKVKGLAERSSRLPGGGPGLNEFKSLAQRVVESDQFKACTWNGRINMQTTISKTRIRPDYTKAVGTIVEGGQTTITPPVGAYPIFPYRVGLIPQRFAPLVMRDVVPVIPLDGTNAVEYVRENWTLSTDYQVLEGDRKPQSGVTYTDFTAPVRTIAHFVKVSRQMAQDVPFIMSTIEQRLQLGVMLKEDREILYGDNTAGHLFGIMPQATKLASFWTPPGTGNTFSSIDELNIAATHIELGFYFPNAIILNPTDEAKIEMLKTTFGSYVLNDRSPREDGLMRLWGLPVITTPNMNVGDFLVGAFPGQCALFDRETVTVEIAFQNEDDFVRNLITLRAEERVAFAVFVPTAFVCGPFSCPPCAGGGPFTGGTFNAPAPPPPPGAITSSSVTHVGAETHVGGVAGLAGTTHVGPAHNPTKQK